MNENKYDVVIVGSGPAGLTAAIYTVRGTLKTLVIAGNQPGGQLTITTIVENFPGFPEAIGGPKLMMSMLQQVRNLGGEISNDLVQSVEKIGEKFKVVLSSGKIIESRSVIMATGAGAKWLGLPKEKELIGRGVSGCATCDGMLFRDKVVAIVGGGNTACEEASFLAKICQKVYMIHRREEFRAGPVEQKKVLENKKIEIWWNSEIKELIDEGQRLKALRVVNNKTGEEKMLEVDGLFVAIGRQPQTELVRDLVELKEEGQIETDRNQKYRTMSSLEGIFAAGDCVDEIYRQAIAAAGDGCRAGIDCQKWLEEKEMDES
jgi:thioredoxin reductase (NADPH)